MVEIIYDNKKHNFISLSEDDHLIKRMKKNESFYEDFLLEKIKSQISTTHNIPIDLVNDIVNTLLFHKN